MSQRPPTTIGLDGRRGRLTPHALLLALALAILFPLVVNGSVWSADVGAQLYQSTNLARGDGWTTPHPFPQADPEGRWFPIHLAERANPPAAAAGKLEPGSGAGKAEYVVLAKHTVLTRLVAVAVSLGGLPAVIAASTVGTLLAALAVARLVGRVDPALSPVGLWVTGLSSPLLFDGYTGYAHTLGAAAVAWATVALMATLDRFDADRPGFGTGLRLMAALGLAAVACLVRTEGAVAVAALALALVVEAAVAWRQRRRRARAPVTMAVALATLMTGVATVTVDRHLQVATAGTANPNWLPEQWSFWSGRFAGLRQTWLAPGRRPDDVLVALSAAAMLAAGRLLRRRVDATITTAMVALAALAIGARWLVAGPSMVTGLIMAFPLLFAGLLTVTAEWISHHRVVRFGVVAFVGFSIGVLAIQYPFGGVAEWGGRYFAVGLPLGIAAAIPPAATAVSSLSPVRARTVAVMLFATSVALSGLGLRELHQTRRVTADLTGDIAHSVSTTDPGDGGTPVVVTTVPLVGRVAWDQVDQGRWLLVESRELGSAGRSLDALGIDSLVLVSFDPKTDIERLAGTYRPETLAFADESASTVDDGSQTTAGKQTVTVLVRQSD